VSGVPYFRISCNGGKAIALSGTYARLCLGMYLHSFTVLVLALDDLNMLLVHFAPLPRCPAAHTIMHQRHLRQTLAGAQPPEAFQEAIQRVLKEAGHGDASDGTPNAGGASTGAGCA
jgi:hypothetical protein